MVPYPDDIGRFKSFVPAHGNIEGHAGLIHRVSSQPVLEPTRRLAQFGGDFWQGERFGHFRLPARHSSLRAFMKALISGWSLNHSPRWEWAANCLCRSDSSDFG
jgi:hypothetical protein